MGLVVDEIVDVVEDHLHIELSGDRPGLLGTAVIAGKATDVIDIGHWLTMAAQDWFRRSDNASGSAKQQRLLIVEDSDFFRQLLVPTLAAAGYHVTAAREASEALRHCSSSFRWGVAQCVTAGDGVGGGRCRRKGGVAAKGVYAAVTATAEASASVTATTNTDNYLISGPKLAFF